MCGPDHLIRDKSPFGSLRKIAVPHAQMCDGNGYAARPHAARGTDSKPLIIRPFTTGGDVDVKGNHVDVEGNHVDVKGNHIAVKGNDSFPPFCRCGYQRWSGAG